MRWALAAPLSRSIARRWTDQRQYDMRCDAKQDLAVWKEACEKAIAKHWYA